MNLQEYENFYHVDISTQIENKWKTDTVLGIVKDSKRYSIKIKAKDKLKIRKRFITRDISKSEKRHNKKIVMITYSYLLYKALCEFNEANPLLLCRDVRPERLVIHYFQRVSNFFENKDILNKKIKFRKRTEIKVPQQTIDSSSANKRIIAPTTSKIDKFIFKMKGCKIMHELNDATALTCPEAVAKGLKNVREDRIFHILDLEADEQIGADDVWAQGIDGINGTGVNVAVLDTGIDTDHPELSGNIVGCETFVDGTTTCEDDHGHGTHVSGIITANGVNPDAKGVAPGAGIYMYKVCDASGSCYESDMMAAMEAAVETDAKVMSISIGGGNYAGENCDSDPLAAKVNWVVEQGINVVVASGNDKYYVSSPGCASGAIAVGAVDKSGLMAYFSNFGPALDIVAPGVSIYSSVIGGGYASWSGTSMATPHVSGVVALMLDNNSTLTTAEIKTALYETADSINPDSVCYGVIVIRRRTTIGVVPCSSDNFGAGIVDAYGAVNYYTPQEPECGDGLVNQVIEECDGTDLVGETCETLEFDYGILTCTAECVYDTGACVNAVCGNAIIEVSEECDGIDLEGQTCVTLGFDAGTLTCNSDCSGFDTSDCYDYVCGNAIIEVSEECDNLNLGGATCETLGFESGDLICTDECIFDTSDCITTEPEEYCGDGDCAGINLGEDCKTCPGDCPSYTRGRLSGRYCCGNSICESAELILGNCPVDC